MTEPESLDHHTPRRRLRRPGSARHRQTSRCTPGAPVRRRTSAPQLRRQRGRSTVADVAKHSPHPSVRVDGCDWPRVSGERSCAVGVPLAYPPGRLDLAVETDQCPQAAHCRMIRLHAGRPQVLRTVRRELVRAPHGSREHDGLVGIDSARRPRNAVSSSVSVPCVTTIPATSSSPQGHRTVERDLPHECRVDVPAVDSGKIDDGPELLGRTSPARWQVARRSAARLGRSSPSLPESGATR